ncbi:sensor histidine kinase [Luteibacter sp. 22Crub2.1]|uniref:sensor histidine kinase n=1 Tax=Luteibacter sp. 22Crub2.1 TaxID=1283288 RepID=UPI0009C7DE37|nr:sensor histidine kinase [Luteibacter sp. 22Crub2.1]SKB27476.1 Signal transduction histidine kinase [Luteibacter sp. 22Crub2.1]
MTMGLAMVLALPAHADSPKFPGFVTKFWGGRDGAPGDINAMAQTSDGWLWLGTSSGLYRFDGKAFAAQDLLPDDYTGSRQVIDIAARPDGDLWVVYGSTAVVHRAADGVVSQPDGLPRSGIDGLFFDGGGRTFATVGDAVYVLSNGHWVRCRSPEWQLPAAPLEIVTIDAEGDVIANTESGVYRLAKGTKAFVRVPDMDAASQRYLIGAPDGRLWRTSPTGLELVPGARAAKPAPGTGSSVFAFDGRGGFWSMIGGCQTLCLRRAGLSPAKKSMAGSDVEALPEGADTLQPMTLLADRAGNIWVGAKEGLARFHPVDTRPVNVGYAGYYFSVLPENDGSVLVGTFSNWKRDDVMRFSRDGKRSTLANEDTVSLVPWENGEALQATRYAAIHLVAGDRWVRWSDRPSSVGQAPLLFMLPRANGTVWAGVRNTGLFEISPQGWVRRGKADGLPDEPPVFGAADRSGHTWLAYPGGRMLRVEGDRAAREMLDTGLGTVAVILPGDPLVVAGERGIAWFDGTAFHPVALRMPGGLRGVTGLARTPDGALWAYGRSGLVRIDAHAMRGVLAGQETDVPFRILTEDDGLQGAGQQGGLPSLHVDAGGILWAGGTLGLATVDPARLQGPDKVHPVILSMSSSHGVLPKNGATLPPDDTALEISFSGLSLGDPNHVQLRYRLKGMDEAWHDSESPNTVKYASLAPGEYRFELQARSTEGDWSAVVSSAAITRTPSFVETTLFRCLVALAAGLLLFGAYQWRIRTLRHRHMERTKAKLAERDRIASELHDSILQGMQAISIRLSAWELDANMPEWMRDRVKALSRQMQGIVLEGRARVVALRSVGQGSMSLSDALRLIGEDHEEGSTVAFELTVIGEETELPDAVQVPVLDILREAVHNAFLHAAASTVTVTLDFAPGALRTSVRDDGRGMPADVLEAGRRPGHWGLVIMRERAEAAGAQFDIASGPTGTCLSLGVALPDERAVRNLRRKSGRRTSRVRQA